MRDDVFVYGTLRRNEQAHVLLGPDAVFVRETMTLPIYTLYQFGWYPGLVEGGSTKVKGEVWSIWRTRWPELDEYEEVPEEYIRKKVALIGGESAYTYIYVGPLHNGVPLSGGDWLTR